MWCRDLGLLVVSVLVVVGFFACVVLCGDNSVPVSIIRYIVELFGSQLTCFGAEACVIIW